MTLSSDLQAQAEKSAASASPDVTSQRLAGIDTVAAVQQGRTVPAVGDVAPDFMLPDATGAKVRLSDLTASGPVVVTFYRGGWCPYCTLELRAWQAMLAELSAAGGTLVAISPDAPDESLSTAEKSSLEFAVLSDIDADAITEFGLGYTVDAVTRAVLSESEAERARRHGVETQILPVPATFVIGSGNQVTYAFVDADYRRRAEPAEVVAAVRG